MKKSSEPIAESLTLYMMGLLCLVGIVASFFTGMITICWGAVIFFSLQGFVNNKVQNIWYGIAASPVLEVWTRTSGAPLLPYETGKYYLFLAIFLLLVHNITRGNYKPLYNAGTIILVMLIPSLFVALAGFDYEQWVFNALGTVELAVLLIFASRERWHIERFCKTLHFAALPIIPFVVYLTLTTKDYDKIDYTLGANSLAAGGSGSNQVSTILGLAMVIMIILQLLRRPLLLTTWLNFLFIGYLFFRCLLTFSRGGLVVAVLSIIISVTPIVFHSLRSFVKYGLLAVIFSVGGLLIFSKVNTVTSNKLLLRFEGETVGTLGGSKTKNLNAVSSGRVDLAKSEWEMFKDNFLFGVGPGGAKKLRPQYGMMDAAAHTEFSRLFGEHGIGGALTTIVLIAFPVWWVKKQRLLKWKAIVSALFTLAILTTFHSATRTNTSTVVFVLAAIPIFYYSSGKKLESANQDIIHRQ